MPTRCEQVEQKFFYGLAFSNEANNLTG